MSEVYKWALEYQGNLEEQRDRNAQLYERGDEPSRVQFEPVVIQAWLEDLSRAIIEDMEAKNQPNNTLL